MLGNNRLLYMSPCIWFLRVGKRAPYQILPFLVPFLGILALKFIPPLSELSFSPGLNKDTLIKGSHRHFLAKSRVLSLPQRHFSDHKHAKVVFGVDFFFIIAYIAGQCLKVAWG